MPSLAIVDGIAHEASNMCMCIGMGMCMCMGMYVHGGRDWVAGMPQGEGSQAGPHLTPPYMLTSPLREIEFRR
jgi:hypothetical protein